MIDACWTSSKAIYHLDAMFQPRASTRGEEFPVPGLHALRDLCLEIRRYPWNPAKRSFLPPEHLPLDVSTYWLNERDPDPGSIFPAIRANPNKLCKFISMPWSSTWQDWQDEWTRHPGMPPAAFIKRYQAWRLHYVSWTWIAAMGERLLLAYASRESWNPPRYVLSYVMVPNHSYPMVLYAPGRNRDIIHINDLQGSELHQLAKFLMSAPEEFLAYRLLVGKNKL